eukprot:Blabericola_migrator_1__2910@NODE_1837_length_3709_cov_113_312740_g519_i1_p2_GENE_NODE_1837_length_3709_cov_113_312740_g519_i1NODE_1837_length_3709_cov_113_312740_g519_i1_p2_ORF_typecomplete_len226_score49_12Mucin/PF01456_17/0_014SWISNF_Ssr4/PF08549_10/0_047DUF3989/PF13150_6/0_37DUF3989/PF13150_6/5_8e03Ribosomal_60s/PF00428_19/1_3DUF202/PF02656_15/1_3DUF202/PF02656_15/67DUF373/PF04123_13/2_5DUF1129/PF06570_11/11_NODE_1837_length_3709_cov_113_312740_g519_i17061383
MVSCDTQDDLKVAFGAVPLAAGLIIVGIVLAIYAAFNFFVAMTASYGGVMLILAYVVQGLILLCGILYITAAVTSKSLLIDFLPQLNNICKIAVFLILLANWAQWLYLMYGPTHWHPGGYNMGNMIISTVLSVLAIATLCHGKSVCASSIKRNDAGISLWKMPPKKIKAGQDLESQTQEPPSPKAAPKAAAKATPKASAAKTEKPAASATPDEDEDEEEDEEDED